MCWFVLPFLPCLEACCLFACIIPSAQRATSCRPSAHLPSTAGLFKGHPSLSIPSPLLHLRKTHSSKPPLGVSHLYALTLILVLQWHPFPLAVNQAPLTPTYLLAQRERTRVLSMWVKAIEEKPVPKCQANMTGHIVTWSHGSSRPGHSDPLDDVCLRLRPSPNACGVPSNVPCLESLPSHSQHTVRFTWSHL